MNFGTNGTELIKHFEGLELSTYKDPIGIPTIGIGHIGAAAYLGNTITENQAEKLLLADIAVAELAVKTYVTDKGINLLQNQYDALVSLVFNLGSHNIFTFRYNNGYAVGSSLYNKLLIYDFDGAAEHFTDFVKADGQVLKGLVRRREAEKALFLKKKSSPVLDFGFVALVSLAVGWVMVKIFDND